MDYMLHFKPVLLKLKAATEQQNWSEVSELNTRLRESVEAAVSSASSEVARQELAGVLKRLQVIINLVLSDAEKNRDELRQELTKLTRDQKAARSYQRSADI